MLHRREEEGLAVRMQTECKTSSCCCCCFHHLPPNSSTASEAAPTPAPPANPALESLADFDQNPARLLPDSPDFPPSSLPLDHLVGGGGEELPRAARLSWRRTLLSSWSEDRQGQKLEADPPAGIHGSEAAGAGLTRATSPNKLRCSAQLSPTAAPP